MSYARFGSGGSDVYVYEHVGGFIECCGCSLAKDEDGGVFGFGFTHLKTAREAIEHLEKHREAGDTVLDRTFEFIRTDHPDLDAQIEPYVEPEEVKERRRFRLKQLFEKGGAESNGV